MGVYCAHDMTRKTQRECQEPFCRINPLPNVDFACCEVHLPAGIVACDCSNVVFHTTCSVRDVNDTCAPSQPRETLCLRCTPNSTLDQEAKLQDKAYLKEESDKKLSVDSLLY